MATAESTEASRDLDPYRWQKRYYNKRYAEDANFKESSKARSVDWQRQKYRNDPVWRAKRLERTRANYHRKKAENQEPTPRLPTPTLQ